MVGGPLDRNVTNTKIYPIAEITMGEIYKQERTTEKIRKEVERAWRENTKLQRELNKLKFLKNRR